MADGVVDIEIPDSSPVAAEMQTVKDSILAGEFDVFDQGAITAQDGTVIIEDGIVQTELTDPFAPDVVVAGDGVGVESTMGEAVLRTRGQICFLQAAGALTPAFFNRRRHHPLKLP